MVRMQDYRIFIINPGSTSTKLSLFAGNKELFTTNILHDSSVLLGLDAINDQLDYRMEVIADFLKEKNIDLNGIDVIVARGGGCYPIEGGTYNVDDRLVEDIKSSVGKLYHSSMLGVQMGKRLHDQYGGLSSMVDPPVIPAYGESLKFGQFGCPFRHAKTTIFTSSVASWILLGTASDHQTNCFRDCSHFFLIHMFLHSQNHPKMVHSNHQRYNNPPSHHPGFVQSV